jgi:hypothetical protein
MLAAAAAAVATAGVVQVLPDQKGRAGVQEA